jgi:hypothetical protein
MRRATVHPDQNARVGLPLRRITVAGCRPQGIGKAHSQESTQAKLEAVTPGDSLAILVLCHLCYSPIRAVFSVPGCY